MLRYSGLSPNAALTRDAREALKPDNTQISHTAGKLPIGKDVQRGHQNLTITHIFYLRDQKKYKRPATRIDTPKFALHFSYRRRNTVEGAKTNAGLNELLDTPSVDHRS